MEVPEIMLKRGGSLPGTVALSSVEGQAATMATPGAAMSGYPTNHINLFVCKKTIMRMFTLRREVMP